MLTTLLYISLITGGILALTLILSLVAGLDLDIDVDIDDGGGIGYVKGGLAFLSIGSYMVRSVLMTSDNPLLAFALGTLAGLITVVILSMFLKWLISQQEEVNYKSEDAVFQTAKVYLKIPKDGQGIIRVPINGVERELKATTNDDNDIETGTSVLVEAVEEEVALVTVTD